MNKRRKKCETKEKEGGGKRITIQLTGKRAVANKKWKKSGTQKKRE